MGQPEDRNNVPEDLLRDIRAHVVDQRDKMGIPRPRPKAIPVLDEVIDAAVTDPENPDKPGSVRRQEAYFRAYGKPIKTDGKRCFEDLRMKGITREFSWGVVLPALHKHRLAVMEKWNEFPPLERKVLAVFLRLGRVSLKGAELLRKAGLDPTDGNHRKALTRLVRKKKVLEHGGRETPYTVGPKWPAELRLPPADDVTRSTPGF